MKTPAKNILAKPELYPLFRTAQNRLTPYAFACGYIERYETRPGEIAGQSVEIWRDGGCNFYNIRAHDYDMGKRIFWEDRKTLREARALFDKTRRAMEKGELATFSKEDRDTFRASRNLSAEGDAVREALGITV